MDYVFEHGSGSKDDPYQVWDADDLNGVRDHAHHGRYFIQMADIDLSGYSNWEPIGTPGSRFSASYNGNGFTISNLTIYKPEDYRVGLFGYLFLGYLENITLINIDITAAGDAGGLAGICGDGSSIVNCSVIGGSIVVNVGGGGLVSFMSSSTLYTDVVKLEKCSVRDVSISSLSGWLVGGFAGWIAGYTVRDCYSICSVSNEWGDEVCSFINELIRGGLVNCFCAGPLTTSPDNEARLAAMRATYEGATISGFYVDYQSTGIDPGTIVFGLPRTTAEMMSESNYVGWDFETIWGIREGEYPYLRGAEPPPPPPPPPPFNGEVWTAEDLFNVRNNPDKEFIQMADIDLSGYNNWAPIGDNDVAFMGSYNGNGKSISNLRIVSGTNSSGLFGVAAEGTIKDITLTNVYINLPGQSYVGSIAGECYGTISGCNVSGIVIGNRFIGGIVGYGSTINDCFNACSVTGSNQVGGIVGADNEPISNCGNMGSITGSEAVGGIVGESYSSISGSHNTSIVSGEYDVGGIVGVAYGSVTSCFNTGSIFCTEIDVGGIIGVGYDDVSKCFNSGNVTCDGYGSAGIASVTYGDVSDCYNVGSISSLAYAGGITSESWGNTFTNCYNAGAIISQENIGALIGYGGSNDVISCYFDVSISDYASGGGTPKNTEEMKSQATFVGWDFNTIWSINPYVNNGYPSFNTSYPRHTGKDYVLVVADPDGSMEFDGTVYKFVKYLERFPKVIHPRAGISVTYEYGGEVVIYDDIEYFYIASGITDPSGPGGFGSYLPDTSRVVESIDTRESYVNFYYIDTPPLMISTIRVKDESIFEGFTVDYSIDLAVGDALITSNGFVFGNSPDPTVADYVVNVGVGGPGEFSATYVGGLYPDIVYYVKAFMVMNDQIVYGNEIEFTVTAEVPDITNIRVTNVQETGFIFRFGIDDLGASSAAVGFVFAKHPSPRIGDPGVTQVHIGTTNKPQVVEYEYIGSVDVGETYYITGYGVNIAGEGYGNDLTFELPELFYWEFVGTPHHGSLTGLDDNDHLQYSRIIRATSLPPPGVDFRGTVVLVEGGVGVADVMMVCVKDEDDNYTWVPLRQ